MPTIGSLAKKTVNSLTASYFTGYDPSDTTQTLSGTTVTWPTSAMNTYVWSNSANYNIDKISPVYTTVNSNSATTWNYQGTDVKSLTANWQNTYTTVQSNSATNWGSGGTISNPNVFYIRSTGNDSTGDGTIGKPYLTAQVAYNTGLATSTPFVLDLGIGTFTISSDIDITDKMMVRGCGGRMNSNAFTTLTISTAKPPETDAEGGSAYAIYVIASDVYLILNATGANVDETDGGSYTCGNGGSVIVNGDGNVYVTAFASGGSGTSVSGSTNGGNGGQITINGCIGYDSLTTVAGGGSGGGGTPGMNGSVSLDNCDIRAVTTLVADALTLGRTSYITGISITNDKGGNAAY